MCIYHKAKPFRLRSSINRPLINPLSGADRAAQQRASTPQSSPSDLARSARFKSAEVRRLGPSNPFPSLAMRPKARLTGRLLTRQDSSLPTLTPSSVKIFEQTEVATDTARPRPPPPRTQHGQAATACTLPLPAALTSIGSLPTGSPLAHSPDPAPARPARDCGGVEAVSNRGPAAPPPQRQLAGIRSGGPTLDEAPTPPAAAAAATTTTTTQVLLRPAHKGDTIAMRPRKGSRGTVDQRRRSNRRRRSDSFARGCWAGHGVTS